MTEKTEAQQQAESDERAQLKKEVDEAQATLATLKSRLEEVDSIRASLLETLDAAKAKLSEIQTVASAAIVAGTKISDEQSLIASKSEHINGAKVHADKIRVELDQIQTSLTQKATEAEGLRTRAQSASDSSTECLNAIRAQKVQTDSELATITAARDVAKTSSSATKDLADIAETVEQQVRNYEKRLEELSAESSKQLTEIVGLLPGATSAGLAHAFDDRRKTFMKPGTRWQWVFVGSVVSLVLLAVTGLWNVYRSGSPLTWDELARLWVARLPIAGALIWLALHSSRESALAKRLEEDYGYKAAIAASFQGFQKQMADIGSTTPEGSPLSKLCQDTLLTIASPPGRIYDKHKLTVTASGEIASGASRIMSLAKPEKVGGN